MFGLLKKKISSFVDKLTRREEAKEAPKPAEPKEEAKVEPEAKPEPAPKPEAEPKPTSQPKMRAEPEPKEAKPPAPAPKKGPEPKPVPKAKPRAEAPAPAPKPKAKAPVGKPGLAKQKKESKLDVKLSIESKVRSLFGSHVTIKEKDVDDLLEQLELDMLEADVAYEVAQALKEEMKKQLVGRQVKKGELREEIVRGIGAALLSVMESEKPDVVGLARAKPEKPFIILFLGPNGAGKTTTIAKFVNLLRQNSMTSVIALADTFRAASQEQGMTWADRLGVKAIGGAYGSDAAAVAYNAREHAKSKGMDAVLIDSAGRQETSKNLMQELAKIVRVVRPDFKIYVGEAIAGNAVVEQVREFDKYVGVDAVVLTKADVDAKGGSAISIYKATGKPILYLGVGQSEADLREFDANWVVGNVMGEPKAG